MSDALPPPTGWGRHRSGPARAGHGSACVRASIGRQSSFQSVAGLIFPGSIKPAPMGIDCLEQLSLILDARDEENPDDTNRDNGGIAEQRTLVYDSMHEENPHVETAIAMDRRALVCDGATDEEDPHIEIVMPASVDCGHLADALEENDGRKAHDVDKTHVAAAAELLDDAPSVDSGYPADASKGNDGKTPPVKNGKETRRKAATGKNNRRAPIKTVAFAEIAHNISELPSRTWGVEAPPEPPTPEDMWRDIGRYASRAAFLRAEAETQRAFLELEKNMLRRKCARLRRRVR